MTKNRVRIAGAPMRILLATLVLAFYLIALPLAMKRQASAPATLPEVETATAVATPSPVAGTKAENAFAEMTAAPMFAPLISATKVDALFTDVDNDGKADPGDTLMYTVVISNTGPDPANSVNFNDTIDANTTLVPGSITISPIAQNDSYNTIGNVHIQVPAAQGLLANDFNPGNIGSLTITGNTNPANGTVTINADGSFTYTPNAGFRGPTDTFTYTLGNGSGKTDTGTVTITINGMIWFVDDSSTDPNGGDGRLATPFKGLVGTDTATVKNFSNSALDQTGDNIFLFSGNYTGGLTLLNTQKLIGQGAPDTILTITGLTAPSGTNLLPATNGTDPVITGTDIVAITLGQGNQLHGFTVGNTGTAGTDIAGTAFTTLTVKDVTVNGTGRALNLTNGSFATGSTFATVESSGGSPAEGVRLNTVGGTLTITTTNIVGPTGTGIDVQSAPTGTSFSFGSTTVTKGSGSAGTGVNLATNLGTYSFSTLTVSTSAGAGLVASSSGTVNVTTGSITSTGGPALNASSSTIGMTFTTLSSTDSAATGVNVASSSGTLSVTTTTVNNSTGQGISVASSSATVSFGSTTSNGSTGTGVSLSGNSGNITFGSLNIAPDNNARGLHATDNTATLTATSGTITTSGATAVEITRGSGNTTLAFVLTTVNANGGPNGILLSNTAGSFSVNANGGTCTEATPTCTGGRIQNTTGADNSAANPAGTGVALNNASNVSLNRMRIDNHANYAVRGLNVTGFTMDNCVVNGVNGTNANSPFRDSSISFAGLFGTATISNSTIAGGFLRNIEVTNSSNLVDFTVNNCTIKNTSAALGDDGISFEVLSTAGADVSITNSNFSAHGGDHFNFSLAGTGTSSLTMTGNTTTGGHAIGLGQGLFILGASFNGTFNYNISDNSITGNRQGGAIHVNKGSGTGTFSGVINNNTIGNAATVGSGSLEASGIDVEAHGTSGSHTTSVTNNQVFHYKGDGMVFIAGEGNPAFNITCTGNTVSNFDAPAGASQHGIHFNIGTLPGETIQACIHVANNSVANAANEAEGFSDIRIRQRQNTTIRLPGYGGANNNNAAVQTFLAGQNTTTTVSAANTVGSGGGGFVGGAACPTGVAPSMASLAHMPEQSRRDAEARRAIGDVKPDYRDVLYAPEADFTGRDATGIDQEELQMIVRASIARWKELGMPEEDIARLEAVEFAIVDLPGDQLMISTPTKILIDRTAADYGWFVDLTPNDDSEFESLKGMLKANPGSIPYDRIDIVSAVTRGLGYVFDHQWAQRSTNRHYLMKRTLAPSERFLPVRQAMPMPDLPVPQIIGPATIPAPAASSTVAEAQSIESQSADVNSTVGASAITQGESNEAQQAETHQQNVAPATVESINLNSPQYANDRGTNLSRSVVRTGSAANGLRPRYASIYRPMSGETVSLSLGTLPAGKSITIMFRATINSSLPNGTCSVSNQGTVSGANFSDVLTDDPDVAGVNNPTVTQIFIAPTITCPANIVTTTDPGVCTATRTFSTTSTGCPVPTVVCTPASGFAFPKGITTVSCTATNSEGSANCSFTVTVTDNQAPVFAGCTNRTVNADPGVCAAAVTFTGLSATDNCDGTITPVCTPASGSTFPKGVTTVNCTATDTSGNSAPCTFTVTVNDNQPPIITCPANGGTFATSDCLPSQRSAYTGTSFYSNATNQVTITNPVLFGFSPCTAPPVSGSSTINFTAIFAADVSVNSGPVTHVQAPATGSMSVTFVSQTGNVRTFSTELLQLDVTGGSLPAGWVLRESPTLQSTGQTLITSVTGGFHIDSFFDVLSDLSINSGSSFNPTANAGRISSVQATDSGVCTAVVNYIPSTATDNCDGTITPICTPAAGSTFPKGVTTVSCAASDSATPTPNTASCTFTVTVVDTQLPSLTCPADISVIGNTCQNVNYTTPTPTDNCTPAPTIVCSPASGFCFPVGTTTVTCTATDSSGNTNSCSFLVNVIPCTITCPANITTNTAPGVCSASVTYDQPTTTGQCGTVTCSPSSGSTFPKGITTVTCSTTAGPSCSFTVTVNDNQAPVFAGCTNRTVNADPGVCAAAVTFTGLSATDNCDGTITPVCTPASGSTFPKGVTTVNCTATDTSGNSTPCTFTVTVNDNQAPVFTGCSNITANTASAVCSAAVNFKNLSANDNCDGAITPVCTPASGSTFPKGVTTVNCTATDTSGNSAPCTFTVTVNDNQAPVFTGCSNRSANITPGTCAAPVTFTGLSANDNCDGSRTVNCTPASGSSFPKGITTVTCTASDTSGNTGNCTFTVTVTDNIPPTIICPANVTKSTDSNLCAAVVTYSAPMVSDTCPGVGAPMCNPASGSVFPKGVSTVTCMVSDASGNQNSCSFTVTVNDMQAPSIVCPGTQSAIPGQPFAYPNPTVTDNCPGATFVCNPPSGFSFPAGISTVTCTATDASGNKASCSFTVTTFDICIQDDSQPNNKLMFLSTTGDYLFCGADGTQYTGKGTVTKKGSTYKLIHNPSGYTLDADVTLGGPNKGNATLKVFATVKTYSIADKNPFNNNCVCGGGN